MPTTSRKPYDSNSSTSNYDSYNKNNEPGYSSTPYSRTTSQPAHSSIPPSNASTQGQGYSGPSSGKYCLPTQAQPPAANGQDRYRLQTTASSQIQCLQTPSSTQAQTIH
jgi:hypothetical protein